MVRDALSRATWIGLVATVPAGLSMQRQLIDQIAAEMGREVKLDAVFEARGVSGALVGPTVTSMTASCWRRSSAWPSGTSWFMLAQASMGHLASKVPASVKVPVLSSPTLAVLKVKEMLAR